ncbi:class I SAM-dependent methyltransferase [Agromyces endophyticus]|uniref:class I SAM-dependent DNA methyltransferase n=1 Tax=Agromyces sp. H17E-10 TaxID=2932244 RepID=UPI001FD392FC|nr:class I SAM-dependent methyltransferase [Agromyces sp. H17E-10]UOQ88587.1 class I SAM-dependent methyltransferase [Agromyces sp. H17E-10]
MAPNSEVRAAYGARADEYTALLGSVEAMAAPDRETIEGWARSLDGRALDVGCGPGHWTQHVRGLGVDITGVDLVPEFVEGARRRFPDVPFELGDLEALPAADDSLGGILAWYSVIHTPPADVPGILGEFARCIRPGGSLLIGFFDGERVEPFDHAVVTAYYWPVVEMAGLLVETGFDVVETHTRTDPGHRPYGAILARRIAV